ncbi:MAG: DUF2559 family protein [Oceanicoccus sp.]|uniref:YhfG family protein n=1 Tax=Oceanicoccus sp. TaxID=2691044 RepID=UPI0026366CB5|nr:YhfG family protein [Oceanicoccus sp.]MDG1771843.1 DUF2559 family protein [Oceanicoccus sp.]
MNERLYLIKANQQTSLATKQAFIAKNRLSNYLASLKLEGIEPPSHTANKPLAKAKVIAKYQTR